MPNAGVMNETPTEHPFHRFRICLLHKNPTLADTTVPRSQFSSGADNDTFYLEERSIKIW